MLNFLKKQEKIENKEKKIKSYPVRLMFSVGNNVVVGISVIFEDENEKANRFVLYYDADLDKIKFTDGESYIKYEIIENKMKLIELLINRKFQSDL